MIEDEPELDLNDHVERARASINHHVRFMDDNETRIAKSRVMIKKNHLNGTYWLVVHGHDWYGSRDDHHLLQIEETHIQDILDSRVAMGKLDW